MPPRLTPARATALGNQLGALLPQPWFVWSSLAAETTPAGAYTLVAPPGTHSLYAFKYGYRAQTTDVTLTAGEIFNADFKLQAR